MLLKNHQQLHRRLFELYIYESNVIIKKVSSEKPVSCISWDFYQSRIESNTKNNLSKADLSHILEP